MYGCLSHAPYWGPGPHPGMCPDWESHRRPFDLQARAQSTEPHQPGRCLDFVGVMSCLMSLDTSGLFWLQVMEALLKLVGQQKKKIYWSVYLKICSGFTSNPTQWHQHSTCLHSLALLGKMARPPPTFYVILSYGAPSIDWSRSVQRVPQLCFRFVLGSLPSAGI